jgi:hypothetical protein
MKLVTFKYSKANGDISNREVVECREPSQFFEGYDVSEMPNEDFAEFSLAYKILLDEHKSKIAALLADFDLNHSYRRFIAKNMSEVTTEHV